MNANAPSLFSQAPAVAAEQHPAPGSSLSDLLYEGFYMVFMLRNGKTPRAAEEFGHRVTRFLGEFEQEAKRHGHAAEDIFDAKYAFSALVDEAVLSSRMAIRDEWELQPLQLKLFGDHLAGEHFFDRLDTARDQGNRRLPALEVFHMCLLLGFKGKYLLEGSEKVGYLSAQLGAQIAHIKGTTPGFAPHWKSPDSVIHTLKREVPVWVLITVLTLFGAVALIGLKTHANAHTAQSIEAFQDLITYSRKPPQLTITLP